MIQSCILQITILQVKREKKTVFQVGLFVVFFLALSYAQLLGKLSLREL